MRCYCAANNRHNVATMDARAFIKENVQLSYDRVESVVTLVSVPLWVIKHQVRAIVKLWA